MVGGVRLLIGRQANVHPGAQKRAISYSGAHQQSIAPRDPPPEGVLRQMLVATLRV